MAQNFLTCDRNQTLLMPPDLRDWLDEDHLAWFVIDAVAELDLEPFYASYGADGHGAAAHDPRMMVTLFAYAYAVGERSARGIERRCREDVAFRVICANQAPDHATIARFRVRHEEALAGLFGQVLGLCGRAGIVDVGVVAVDGTKLAAAASDEAIRATSRSPPRSSPRPVASTPPRMRSTARPAAMSCPKGFAPRTAGAPGFARPKKSSSASGPSAPRPAGGDWPKTGGPSAGQTRPTRPTARAG